MILIKKSSVTEVTHVDRASTEPQTAERVSAETLLARAKACGMKLTPQRKAIVRELCAEPTHPTAQELFERLGSGQARPNLPGMSFATVYNTLDALTAAGLCSVRALAKGATRFDPNTTPHHHTVCDQCGMVRDVPTPSDALPSTRSSLDGFVVRTVEQVYRGLCLECQGGPAAVTTSEP